MKFLKLIFKVYFNEKTIFSLFIGGLFGLFFTIIIFSKV
jgi:hypothetical protein